MGLSQRRSGGHESAAIRRVLSQRRAGGVISRERRAWGSGNPGTRQPAGGLGRATAGGGYLPRSAGMRASRPADSRRSHQTPTPSCSGLWRDYERRLPCRGTNKQEQNKNFSKNRKQNEVKGRRLRFRSGLLSRCTHEGGTGHADEDVNSNNNI